MHSQMHLAVLCAIILGTIVSCISPATWHNENFKRNADIQKVHIVYMNHLDVGYAGLINEILNEYFQVYYPRAIDIWNGLQKGGYVETFIYTTHPWLVAMYLDCPPNLVLSGVKLQCPNDAQKAAFIDAVKKGCITWHAGPMNLQVEVAHFPWLFEYGLDLGIQLDKRFNITRPTRVLSQRDVPGLTQAAIPSLVKKGITGVSVGVNNMTPPPAVPQLFIWQYGDSADNSVMATWHPGGYPDNPGPDPAHPGGLSPKDCVVVDGLSEALCFAFRTDNSGPPESVGEVLQYYEILRAEFPKAQLTASRLEDFFVAAKSITSKLPIVRNEIGDTWIQGTASDPRRCAEYRAVTRVMNSCFNDGRCALSDVRVWNASQFLIKVPEHTWGLSTDEDTVNWANDKFHALQFTKPSFLHVRDSWNEQRMITYYALDALRDHSIVQNIYKELSSLAAAIPDLKSFTQVSDVTQVFKCNADSVKLQFGADGSIASFIYQGKAIASTSYPIGRFIYVTYNETDIDEFGRVYNYNGNSPGYNKVNLTQNAAPESRSWPIKMIALYLSRDVPCEFYAELKMVDAKANTYYGAPETVFIHYIVRPTEINIDLQWFNKPSTRLPEAFFFAFSLDAQQMAAPWTLSKLGHPVDPLNVLLNGSQHQHVVDDNGVTCAGVQISSPDVPIVCPITGRKPISIYPAPLHPITDPITGMAFNIYNNIWETNWIFWYPFNVEDTNLKARFSVDFKKVQFGSAHDRL